MDVRRYSKFIWGILGLSLCFTLLPQRVAFAGGDRDNPDAREPGYTKRREVSVSGSGRIDYRSDDDGDYNPDVDPDELAMMFICQYSRMPGNPFSNGDVSDRWDPTTNNLSIFSFDKRGRYGFKDFHCEKFVLEMLLSYNQQGSIVSRCTGLKEKLFRLLGQGQGQSSSGRSFRRSGASRGGSSAGDRICSGKNGRADENQVACAYNDLKKEHDGADQAEWAADVLDTCRGAGVNMNVRGGGGGGNAYYPNPYGSGGCAATGGVTILKRQNTGLETVLNFGLGLAKIGLPMYAMYNANKLHERNASKALDYNYKLGYPSAVTAGQGGGGMYGGGYGGGYGGSCMGGMGGCGMIGGNFGMGGGIGGGACIYGGGGCGGHYGGMGGGPILGGGYSGMGGSCPTGACYGNGGVVVGGSGGFGGGCGIPPYLANGMGCGGGMGGGMGYPGGGMGYPGGGMGMGGMGGNPFPGPLGTANGGNGWGYPGGGMGMGGGMGGSPWGANGMYNAPFGGASGNAAYMANYANQYQQYLAAQQKQAQQAASYAKIYQQNMEDSNKLQEKTYQSYVATMQAQQGLGGGFGGGMAGGGFQQAGGYQMQTVNSYYPPYYSQPTTGNRFSVGFQGQF